MSDLTQQYDGRLYTEVEVGQLLLDARAEWIKTGTFVPFEPAKPLQEAFNNLTPETPCLADQPL